MGILCQIFESSLLAREFTPDTFSQVEQAIRALEHNEKQHIMLWGENTRLTIYSCRFDDGEWRLCVQMDQKLGDEWKWPHVYPYVLLSLDEHEDDRYGTLTLFSAYGTSGSRIDIYRLPLNETFSVDMLIQLLIQFYQHQEISHEKTRKAGWIRVRPETDMRLSYGIPEPERFVNIHRPTKNELQQAISYAKYLKNFGMHIDLQKGNWTILISPALDDSDLDNDDEYDKYLKENEAERIHIQIWTHRKHRRLYIKLIDVNLNDYQTEITYSDGVFMWDYMYRSLPFPAGVEYILQFHTKTRLQNYFRELDMSYYKTISYCSHYFDDTLIRLNTSQIDNIIHTLDNFTSNRIQRLYLRFIHYHVLITPVEKHQRVMITSFQRLSEDRIEKARLVDKSLYPSNDLVTVRFSDTKSEQVPLHQTIAIDDAIDFVRDALENRNNFCWNGSWY